MQNKIEKTTAILISVFILMTSLIYVPDWNLIGISDSCSILQRLAFSFFHASFLHAALNAWYFLSIVFLYDVSWCRLLSAYVIAAITPSFALTHTPTVGLSAICFALAGTLALQTRHKIYFNVCMAICLAVGCIVPSVNGWIHVYSYVAGLLVGLLVMPIPCRR